MPPKYHISNSAHSYIYRAITAQTPLDARVPRPLDFRNKVLLFDAPAGISYTIQLLDLKGRTLWREEGVSAGSVKTRIHRSAGTSGVAIAAVTIDGRPCATFRRAAIR